VPLFFRLVTRGEQAPVRRSADEPVRIAAE